MGKYYGTTGIRFRKFRQNIWKIQNGYDRGFYSHERSIIDYIIENGSIQMKFKGGSRFYQVVNIKVNKDV